MIGKVHKGTCAKDLRTKPKAVGSRWEAWVGGAMGVVGDNGNNCT